MYFYTRNVSSILTSTTEIERMGLSPLNHLDVNNGIRKVEYQVRWLGMKRGFHPEIVSKKGQKIKGSSGYYTSREWKILPEDYETLEKFLIGFKVLNSLSIIRYRQDNHIICLDVSDETQCVGLDDIKPRYIQPTDDFLLQREMYMDSPKTQYLGMKKWGTPSVLSNGFSLKETLKKETTEKYVETMVTEYEESGYV